MKKLISFSKFLALPKEIQEQLSTLPNEYLQEELSPKDTKRKMLELERALKQKDWTYFASDDGRDRKRGEVENEKIIKMRDELGTDGNALFDMYYQMLIPKYFREDFMGVRETKKDSRPSHYEKFLYKKMKEWDIQSLDELEGETKKRFDKELEDYEGDGEDEVEVNMSNMDE